MAYLEIRKDSKLVQRRQIDDGRASRGIRIRLGSLGSVHIKIGETARLGKYDVELLKSISILDNTKEEVAEGHNQDTLAFSRINAKESGSSAPKDQDQAKYPNFEGYKIIGPLGEGGMGTVWRAVQLSTKRPVALKLLGNRYFTSDTARSRFEREVSLSSKLTHPNIARIYDSGLHKGIYFYVMELIEGFHLDRFVEDSQLDQRSTLSLIQKVCMAIEYAHGEGVIHRDLKPSNILVTPDEEPHVLDFGLAKALESEPNELVLSIEGQITGTLAYMSPEQAEGNTQEINERSDIYGLGVILYQLLMGTLPHNMEGSRLAVLKRIAEEDIIRPRSVNRRIKRDLEAILLQALALRPEERYATAGGLAMDIQNYLSGGNIKAKGIHPLYLLYRRFKGNLGPIVRFVSLSIVGLAAIFAVRFLWIRFQNFQADWDETKQISSAQSQQQRTMDTREELAAQRVMRHQKEAFDLVEQIKKMIEDKNWVDAYRKIRQFENQYSDTNASLYYKIDIARWKRQSQENIEPQELLMLENEPLQNKSIQEQNRLKRTVSGGRPSFNPWTPVPTPQRGRAPVEDLREMAASSLIFELQSMLRVTDPNWTKAQKLFERLERDYRETYYYQAAKYLEIAWIKTRLEEGLKADSSKQSEQQGTDN